MLALLQSIIRHVCYAIEWLMSGCRTPPYERVGWPDENGGAVFGYTGGVQ